MLLLILTQCLLVWKQKNQTRKAEIKNKILIIDVIPSKTF